MPLIGGGTVTTGIGTGGTPNGRFFLLHTSRWEGERDHIEPVSPDEARQYYEDLPEHEMTYEEAFGEAPEEA